MCGLCMQPEFITKQVKVEPLLATKTTKILQLNTKSKRLKYHAINLADPTAKQLSSTSVFDENVTHWLDTTVHCVNYSAL